MLFSRFQSDWTCVPDLLAQCLRTYVIQIQGIIHIGECLGLRDFSIDLDDFTRLYFLHPYNYHTHEKRSDGREDPLSTEFEGVPVPNDVILAKGRIFWIWGIKDIRMILRDRGNCTYFPHFRYSFRINFNCFKQIL